MAKSSSKVRAYVPRSEKDVEEHANQSGGMFDSIFKPGVDVWRPKNGDNTIRFLEPTWEPHRYYGYEIWVHNGVGPDNGTYLCLNKMQRKQCPVCEASLEAKRSGEDDEAASLTSKKRFVCWILDRAERDANPQIYSMPWTVDRDIAALCKNRRTGKVLFIDHPDEGYDVSFTRKTGADAKMTKYFGFQIDHDPSPLVDDDKKLDEIREYITENPVPDQLRFYSYDHIKAALTGGAKDEDKELDEPEKNEEEEETKLSRKPSTAKRQQTEEELPEDEEDDEEDTRSRRRVSPKQEKKDKEVEDEDDDDEEESPRRKSAPFDEEDEEEEKPRKVGRVRR